jgi:hypothetical protein
MAKEKNFQAGQETEAPDDERVTVTVPVDTDDNDEPDADASGDSEDEAAGENDAPGAWLEGEK